MLTATIFDIERNSFVDGPGIRTTVFFKGCNLRCEWCHNPESQSMAPQMMFYRDQCKGCGKCKEICKSPENCTLCGRCVIFCPADARKVCGKTYTSDEVLAEVIKDKAYYENSGGGVTFSGGECMLQIDFLAEILKNARRMGFIQRLIRQAVFRMRALRKYFRLQIYSFMISSCSIARSIKKLSARIIG